jgi:hypothetical protein
MKKLACIALVFAVSAIGIVLGQSGSGTPFRIERLDGALDTIIAADAALETLGDRFALTEGPVWVREGNDGYLLFSDNAANVIYKWSRNASRSATPTIAAFTSRRVLICSGFV